jgi:hypothetical protein
VFKKRDIKEQPKDNLTPKLKRTPRCILIAGDYRLVAKPFVTQEGEEIDQLVIEEKRVNTLNETYYVAVETDTYPEGIGDSYSMYYPKYLWACLKELAKQRSY